MIRRVVAIIGFLLLAGTIGLVSFWAYSYYSSRTTLQTGDILLLSRVQSEEGSGLFKMQADILRNDKLYVADLNSDFLSSQILNYYYDGKPEGNIYYISRKGFFQYKLATDEVIQHSNFSDGVAMKVKDDTIWYSYDNGMNIETVSDGYTSGVCAFNTINASHSCISLNNIQVHDFDIDAENIYATGFQSDLNGISGMEKVFKHYSMSGDILFEKPLDSIILQESVVAIDSNNNNEVYVYKDKYKINEQEYIVADKNAELPSLFVENGQNKIMYFGSYDKTEKCTTIVVENNNYCSQGFFPAFLDIYINRNTTITGNIVYPHTMASVFGYEADNMLAIFNVNDLIITEYKFPEEYTESLEFAIVIE